MKTPEPEKLDECQDAFEKWYLEKNGICYSPALTVGYDKTGWYNRGALQAWEAAWNTRAEPRPAKAESGEVAGCHPNLSGQCCKCQVDHSRCPENNIPDCEHTWPSMSRSMDRQCMRCGVSEQEVFDQKRAETFAEIGNKLETERTMHNAWRKRVEEAEAELNSIKAAQTATGSEMEGRTEDGLSEYCAKILIIREAKAAEKGGVLTPYEKSREVIRALIAAGLLKVKL